MNTNKFLADYLNNPIKDANRKGFGIGLLKAGELNENIVALCADLTESTQMHLFKEKFEDRFFDVGVAEQNLVTVGSGFALMGKIPFVSSYAAFSPGRNWEQIRTTVCLNDVPVKIIGSHAGVSVGPDGATHQMLEDIGKAYVLKEGKDISIMATGTMTYQALIAAHNLEKSGINAEVVHVPTIKPLDIHTILSSAKKTNLVLTIEEAQVAAGFGSAVSEFLSEVYPVKIKRMGIEDHFGESGTPDELLKKFKLDYEHIELNVHYLLGR